MEIIMKRQFTLILTTLLVLTSFFSTIIFAETAEEKGYRIMKAVDQLPTFEKTFMESVFKIYDASGKRLFTKKFRSASFNTDYKDPAKRLSKAISYFYAPADDKGNAALMMEKPGDEDNDQWMYLKGLRKPKRIIGSDKSSSYMGSDFSNGDISRGDFDDYNYKWLATEKYKFKKKTLKLEKIEIIFKDEQDRDDYGYSKMVALIHPASGMIFKGDSYNLDGLHIKTMEMLSFKAIKNKDGKKVFTPTGMKMSSLTKGTKTIMETKKIIVEKKAKKITAKIFKLDYLTRRWW
jgi:hypothetical protein